MMKQRRESADQYQKAGRDDLVQQETFELKVISTYLPQPLDEQEIDALITESINDAEATSMRDMGKVMSLLRPVSIFL